MLETFALWVVAVLGVPSGVVDWVSGLLGGLALAALLVGLVPTMGRGGHDRQVAATWVYASSRVSGRPCTPGCLRRGHAPGACDAPA